MAKCIFFVFSLEKSNFFCIIIAEILSRNYLYIENPKERGNIAKNKRFHFVDQRNRKRVGDIEIRE